jgi:pantetheine-phosphate adenylyltransferase
MPPTVLPPSRRSGSTALYAFSADPITYGHIDVVERVSHTFDQVIVGIGRNPMKKYLFSLEARLALARQALAHLSGVTVLPFHGMVVDFATEQGAQVIVKGVRNVTDFDYEQVHHLVGLSQRAGIDTHILFANPALAHVSSSAVKAIQLEHGFIHEFGDLEAVRDLNRIMTPAVTVGLRKALYGLRGLVLMDGALLAEQGLLPLCNNRVVLVGVAPEDQTFRLSARGWGSSEAKARVAAQWTEEDKGRAIEQAIERSRFGRLWRWDGSAPVEDQAAALLRQLLAETGALLDRAPHAA